MTSTITLQLGDLDHLRFTLREQLAGDVELLREVQAGLASRFTEDDVLDRLAALDRLAVAVGGLY